jgi:hypothetical protein
LFRIVRAATPGRRERTVRLCEHQAFSYPWSHLMRTAFTELTGVPYPIVGFNRSPAVVAAVTNAGGLGVLAASVYTPAELDAQLTWIEEQTGGKP